MFRYCNYQWGKKDLSLRLYLGMMESDQMQLFLVNKGQNIKNDFLLIRTLAPLKLSWTFQQKALEYDQGSVVKTRMEFCG